jgi:hypothetical protein
MKAVKGRETKPLIRQLLGFTEMEYELQLFESAYKYLELQKASGKLTDEDCKALVNTSHFWFWWMYQWENRNRIVLHQFSFTDMLMVPSELVRKRARDFYDYIHEVAASNILINRHVMRMTFERVCIMTDVKQPANRIRMYEVIGEKGGKS